MGTVMSFVMSILLCVGAMLHLLFYRRLSRLKKAAVFTLGAAASVLSMSAHGTTACFSHMVLFTAGLVGGVTSLAPALVLSQLLSRYLNQPDCLYVSIFAGGLGLLWAKIPYDHASVKRLRLSPAVALTFALLPLPAIERVLSSVGILLVMLIGWHLEHRMLRLSAMRHYLSDCGYVLLMSASGEMMMESPALRTNKALAAFLHGSLLQHLEVAADKRLGSRRAQDAVPLHWGQSSFLMTLHHVSLPMGETGVMAAFQDVTHVSAVVRKLTQFFALSAEGFCLLTNDRQLMVANPALERMLGLSTQELLTRDLMEFFYPEDHELVRSTLEQLCSSTKSVARLKIRLRRIDGACVWVSGSVSRTSDQNLIYAVVRDVSDMNRREEELKQHNQRRLDQARMLEMTDEAIVVYAMDHTISYWNRGAEKLYGYQAATALGQDGHKLLYSRFPSCPRRILLELMENSQWQGVLTRCTCGGETRFVDVRQTIKRDALGRPTGIIEMSTDVTELRHIERKRSHLAAVVENTIDAVVSLSPHGIVRTWNRGAEVMLGYQREEVVERPIYAVLPLASYHSVGDILHRVRSGETIDHVSDMIPHRDGRDLHTASVLFPLRDEGGRLSGISIVARDVTQQRTMERESVRLERLNVMGQLAAGIGHELRNPMTTVRGFLQLFAGNPELLSIRKQLDIMLNDLDAANQIITQFLTLARHRSLELECLDLNEIIYRVTPLLRADALLEDRHVEVRTVSLPRLRLGERDISQLIINLARNGLQSMEPGGVLTISTHLEDGRVRLNVRDEGHGITEDIADKIWTPFFTTRDGATGLGLAVCESIAEQHGARIFYTSHERGTTFTVMFQKEGATCQT